MHLFLLQSKKRKLKRTISKLTGLIGYWPLSETSGNAINYAPSSLGLYPGTVSNVTQGQPGVVGNSYSFDGNGDRVIITGFVPAATFSFFVAVKRNGTPDANDRFIDQASSGPVRGWHLQFGTDGAAGLRTWDNAGIKLVLDYGILNNNQWYTLGGSIGLTSSKIYLNGVEVDSDAGNSFGSGIVADLQFGARSGGTSSAFSGFLQHVAIASGVEWSADVHQSLASFII